MKIKEQRLVREKVVGLLQSRIRLEKNDPKFYISPKALFHHYIKTETYKAVAALGELQRAQVGKSGNRTTTKYALPKSDLQTTAKNKQLLEDTHQK